MITTDVRVQKSLMKYVLRGLASSIYFINEAINSNKITSYNDSDFNKIYKRLISSVLLKEMILIKKVLPKTAASTSTNSDIFNNIYKYWNNLDNDVKLTKMTIKSGKIIVTAVSTIEEQVRFQYIIPKATYNNQVAGVNSVLPPAPIGGQVTLVKEYDLAGHTVDLTVDGTKYNQMEQIRIASIDSSGNMITITKSRE
jgi:hypothetical protein